MRARLFLTGVLFLAACGSDAQVLAENAAGAAGGGTGGTASGSGEGGAHQGTSTSATLTEVTFVTEPLTPVIINRADGVLLGYAVTDEAGEAILSVPPRAVATALVARTTVESVDAVTITTQRKIVQSVALGDAPPSRFEIPAVPTWFVNEPVRDGSAMTVDISFDSEPGAEQYVVIAGCAGGFGAAQTLSAADVVFRPTFSFTELKPCPGIEGFNVVAAASRFGDGSLHYAFAKNQPFVPGGAAGLDLGSLDGVTVAVPISISNLPSDTQMVSARLEALGNFASLSSVAMHPGHDPFSLELRNPVDFGTKRCLVLGASDVTGNNISRLVRCGESLGSENWNAGRLRAFSVTQPAGNIVQIEETAEGEVGDLILVQSSSGLTTAGPTSSTSSLLIWNITSAPEPGKFTFPELPPEYLELFGIHSGAGYVRDPAALGHIDFFSTDGFSDLASHRREAFQLSDYRIEEAEIRFSAVPSPSFEATNRTH